MLIVEFFVLHSIKEEVDQIQHHGFTAFSLNGSHDIIVGVRMIFDKNLSDHTHLRLFHIQPFYAVEILYDFPHVLRVDFSVEVQNIVHNRLIPFLHQSLTGTGSFLIGPSRIEKPHHQISVNTADRQHEAHFGGNFKTGVLFQSDDVE